MGGRKLAADRVAAVLELLEAGLSPNRAGPAAGVSRTVAYNLDRRVRGVGRLEAKRAAAAAGARRSGQPPGRQPRRGCGR